MKTFAIEHRNQACNLLSGNINQKFIVNFQGDKLTYYYNCTREKTDKIKEALINSYDAVLITEQFDKSMILLLKYMMGFELSSVEELTYIKHKVMHGRPTVEDLPPDVLEVRTCSTIC